MGCYKVLGDCVSRGNGNCLLNGKEAEKMMQRAIL